ncbi:MAG: EMC3/TMCO1 family protein [Candidatus Altiarchaeota archaeon]
MNFLITEAGQIIALISIALSVFSIFARILVLGKDKIKEMKEQIKKSQKEMKEATKSGDKKRALQAQEAYMKITIENMRHSFKPLIITFIPFVLVFGWLKENYGNSGNVAIIFGIGFDWFLWYLACAMLFSILISKILKLD